VAQTELFRRFDRLFTGRITESTSDGRWGSHEVRAIMLNGGVTLRCAMDEEQAYWYEVVFPEGDRIMVRPGEQPSASNTEILASVLREADAA